MRSLSALTALTIAAISTLGLLLHEAQVELDDVRAQQRHQRERAGVGADVVERDPPAARAHRLDRGEQVGGPFGQRALGYLDDDVELVGGARPVGVQVIWRLGAKRARLDVDEEGAAAADGRLERAARGGGAAFPVEMDQAAGLRGGGEQAVGALERRALWAAGQRLPAATAPVSSSTIGW